MKIGGLQKTSLLDYPGKISAIIWTVGCNFKCPFCYNPQLVKGEVELIDENKIFSFLKKRKNLLEAVSITGGEPLLQQDIVGFTEKLKKMGYLVKIDTNGTFPDRLEKLLDEKLVDYVSMDVKAPLEKYNELTGVKVNVSKIKKSIEIIKNQASDYEFKTTIIPSFLSKEDIVKIAELLKNSKRYYLQQFKNDTPLISEDLRQIKPYPREYLEGIIEQIKPFFKQCKLRGI